MLSETLYRMAGTRGCDVLKVSLSRGLCRYGVRLASVGGGAPLPPENAKFFFGKDLREGYCSKIVAALELYVSLPKSMGYGYSYPILGAKNRKIFSALKLSVLPSQSMS